MNVRREAFQSLGAAWEKALAPIELSLMINDQKRFDIKMLNHYICIYIIIYIISVLHDIIYINLL